MTSREVERNGLLPTRSSRAEGISNENVIEANNTSHATFQQEYKILAEYKMIQSENLNGVYVIPSCESSLLWFGVVFVHNGFYTDGIFRFNIVLPDNFPNGGHPTVIFQNEVFHPSIDVHMGTVDLTQGFPIWKSGENHIWQVLKYVQWIFSNPQTKNPVNADASELLKTNKEKFMERTRECVKLSLEHLYDQPPTDDKHYITFDLYNSTIHDTVRDAMLSSSSIANATTGLSWVQEGTYRPLSKPTSEPES